MEENFIEKLINNLKQDRELWGDSFNWANWMSQLAFNTCQYCVEQHGKIVDISVFRKQKVSKCASQLPMRICTNEN